MKSENTSPSLTVNTAEYIDMLLSLLDGKKGDLPLPVKGFSMVPFLHEGDTVYINRLSKDPRRGDILLYRRPDGTYVLHRVKKCTKSGVLLLLGDGQTQKEPVLRQWVFAEATSAKRKGRLITKKSPVWRFYSTLWLLLSPLRPIFGKIHNAKKK